MNAKAPAPSEIIDRMFKAGAHYGYSRSRRHPSVEPFVFGAKNRTEIFDLERTSELLARAAAFARSLGAERKTILLVGGKNEAREIISSRAQALNMPYVAGRWIGGTLTNFPEIKKRMARLTDLIDKREKGELESKYTKRERLMFDREITDLTDNFGGIMPLRHLPAALYVVDTRRERAAIAEAKALGIPVIGLMNSDCDVASATYPLIGNDAARESISFFTDHIASAYREGLSEAPLPKAEAAA